MADKLKKSREPKTVRGGGGGLSKVPTESTSELSKNEVVLVNGELSPNKSYYIHAKWLKASFLKNAIEAVKNIIIQTNIDWIEEGISIQGMDASHVALSNMFLSKNDCIFYHIKESITTGIDMVILNRLLGTVDDEDSLEFFIKSDSDATINVTLVSSDNKKRSHFQIPLLDIDTDSMNIPEMIYKGEIIQKSSDILCTVRDLSFFGDSVMFGIENNEFQIRVEGDYGKGERAWKDGILQTTNNVSEIQQSYPIKYMLMALKGTSVSPEVHIKMSHGSPIQISYSFGKSSKIVNYVAPKIEDMDE